MKAKPLFISGKFSFSENLFTLPEKNGNLIEIYLLEELIAHTIGETGISCK